MELERLKSENEELREQLRLLQEINVLKAANTVKPWPHRMSGCDPDWFRGMCIS